MRNMSYTIEHAIERIREFRRANGFAKNRLAVLAGVPEGCIRSIDDKDWNPTLVTIKKLEKVIPANFPTTTNSKKHKKENT